jgi:Recombination endonuclease VII
VLTKARGPIFLGSLASQLPSIRPDVSARKPPSRPTNKLGDERVQTYAQKFYAAHREQRHAESRVYRADHREERSAYDRAYYAAHAEEIRDRVRARDARLGGYAAPPAERECPPRTDHCQYCHAPMDPAKVFLDHNHNTGAFLAWCCRGCNAKITDDRIDDFGQFKWSMKKSARSMRKRAAERMAQNG